MCIYGEHKKQFVNDCTTMCLSQSEFFYKNRKVISKALKHTKISFNPFSCLCWVFNFLFHHFYLISLKKMLSIKIISTKQVNFSKIFVSFCFLFDSFLTEKLRKINEEQKLTEIESLCNWMKNKPKEKRERECCWINFLNI